MLEFSKRKLSESTLAVIHKPSQWWLLFSLKFFQAFERFLSCRVKFWLPSVSNPIEPFYWISSKLWFKIWFYYCLKRSKHLRTWKESPKRTLQLNKNLGRRELPDHWLRLSSRFRFWIRNIRMKINLSFEQCTNPHHIYNIPFICTNDPYLLWAFFNLTSVSSKNETFSVSGFEKSNLEYDDIILMTGYILRSEKKYKTVQNLIVVWELPLL